MTGQGQVFVSSVLLEESPCLSPCCLRPPVPVRLSLCCPPRLAAELRDGVTPWMAPKPEVVTIWPLEQTFADPWLKENKWTC